MKLAALAIGACLALISALGLDAYVTHKKLTSVIELTEENTVLMDKVFDDDSVTAVMVELQKKADTLSNGSTVYLVLNTPGGSVDAGLRLVTFIKALPIKVKTLTLFAASMGFQTAQQLDERLILDSGTLMSHRATFGVQGEAPGEMFARIKWIMSMIDALDAQAASRMGLEFDKYRELIRDEYWVYGSNAVKDGAADRAVLATCGKGLKGSRTELYRTIIGNFNVELSKCPLMPGFISVQYMGDRSKVSHEELVKHENYIRMLVGNKRAFVQNYITNNAWETYQ